MNLLGRRSLSSFFKLLLDVAFYVLWATVAVTVGVAIVASRAQTTNSISLSLPVRFEIDPSAYQIQRAGGAAFDARIDEASGNVTVKQPLRASVLITVAGLIAIETVLLVIVYRVRRIFRRLVEGRPFLDENARSLRFIGLTVIGGELVWTTLQYLGQRAVAATLSSG